MTPPRSSLSIGLVCVIVAICGWTAWLRAPSWGVTLWNVDESIHAAAARSLLEGGVMYRDAVDQRTPLTYYAFAAIFKLTGTNNLFAVRVAIAGLIAATAFGLFLLGKRSRSFGTGVWAALIFCSFATGLFSPADAHAAHTEWFVAFFTTAGAVTFLTVPRVPGFGRALLAGIFYGLAFLSKQPALTDLGAPVGTLLYLFMLRAVPRQEVARAAGGLVTGAALIVLGTFALFLAAGAGKELLFYTWTYNVHYYGPEVSWGDRVLSAWQIVAALAQHFPVLLASVIIAGLVLAVRVAQLRYSDEQYESRRSECFLLLWCATSLAGAMSSGRGYEHYFFQCLPPFAWLAAWLPGRLLDYLKDRAAPVRVILTAIVTIGIAVNLVWASFPVRKVTAPPPDPALRLSAFVRERSKPEDKIFVWGYNPDIYLYADRAAASRFLYCTFQTGLIPWTNEKPGVDTRYAIVPGAMDDLLADLRRNQPAFIVDCGVGPHRRFSKYPLQDFRPLHEYVTAHYVEVDPATFVLQGFRLFMLRDSTARPAAPVAPPNRHPLPTLAGPVGGNAYVASAIAADATLQRLAIEQDGTELAAVRFPPAPSMKFQAAMPPGSSNQKQQLQAVAYWLDGSRTVSAPLTPAAEVVAANAEQRSEFALPRISGAVPVDGLRALLSPNATTSDNHRFFNLHAPSILRYQLPTGVTALRGRFGVQPGAYAPDNTGPTDGAVFSVRFTSGAGETRILLEKWLRPAVNPADQPAQSFHLPFNVPSEGGLLELEISPGPDGNMASDWTYWSDLMLEVSR